MGRDGFVAELPSWTWAGFSEHLLLFFDWLKDWVVIHVGDQTKQRWPPWLWQLILSLEHSLQLLNIYLGFIHIPSSGAERDFRSVANCGSIVVAPRSCCNHWWRRFEGKLCLFWSTNMQLQYKTIDDCRVKAWEIFARTMRTGIPGFSRKDCMCCNHSTIK